MRIAMVTGSYPPQPCGVGDYTERLVTELRSAGIAVDVITTAENSRGSTVSVQYAIDKWTLKSWRKALLWLRSQQCELIHIQYPARFYGYRPTLGFLSMLAKMILPGIPIVVTLHEFRITHVLRKFTSIALAAPASALLLTADSERTIVERWMPWLRSRLRVLTMASTIPVIPVSDQRRRELRRSCGIADNDVVIAYFGLLHPNKGIETLLQAFAAVHGERADTKLMMLSLFEPSTNPYHAELQAEVASLGIEGAVIWPGYLDNRAVSEHLACADIGFFPFQDGVTLRRLSFMTGMAHALPILTTSGHAGTEEIGLRDGENVLLVPAGASNKEFVARLLLLTEKRSLRSLLANGAREWAAPFQWKEIVPRHLTIYGQILGRCEPVPHLER